jgi:hypothetical protein
MTASPNRLALVLGALTTGAVPVVEAAEAHVSIEAQLDLAAIATEVPFPPHNDNGDYPTQALREPARLSGTMTISPYNQIVTTISGRPGLAPGQPYPYWARHGQPKRNS